MVPRNVPALVRLAMTRSDQEIREHVRDRYAAAALAEWCGLHGSGTRRWGPRGDRTGRKRNCDRLMSLKERLCRRS